MRRHRPSLLATAQEGAPAPDANLPYKMDKTYFNDPASKVAFTDDKVHKDDHCPMEQHRTQECAPAPTAAAHNDNPVTCAYTQAAPALAAATAGLHLVEDNSQEDPHCLHDQEAAATLLSLKSAPQTLDKSMHEFIPPDECKSRS
eukprot:jgi/Ulvmu1/5159/UM021_0176.1